MPITFPSNPTVGNTHVTGGSTWTWNGKYWSKAGSGTTVSSGSASVTVANSAPSSPTTGALWVNNETGDLNSYFSNAWVIIGGGGRLASPSIITTSNINSLTATTVTVYGSQFGSLQGTLRYIFGTTVEDVYVLPTTNGLVTATVPANVASKSQNTLGSLTWYRADGIPSNSFNLTIQNPSLQVQYLVVGGGGGGGGRVGAGGGGGGYRSSVVGELSGGNSTAEIPLSLATGINYSVTVGAGGSGGPTDTIGGTGSNSSVTGTGVSVIALGGGGGNGGTCTTPGAVGGSGGGGSYGGAGGAGTVGQGYAGGIGGTLGDCTGGTYPYKQGGGGGAGAVGTAGSISTGKCGDGGAGLYSSITGSSVAYAGGGGGGSHNPFNSSLANSGQGLGGVGGGANGAIPGAYGNGGNGTANTGGGGGGASSTGGGTNSGGNGGNGIVILKYPSVYSITVGAGLTSSTVVSGPYKITSFTNGGGTITFS